MVFAALFLGEHLTVVKDFGRRADYGRGAYRCHGIGRAVTWPLRLWVAKSQSLALGVVMNADSKPKIAGSARSGRVAIGVIVASTNHDG